MKRLLWSAAVAAFVSGILIWQSSAQEIPRIVTSKDGVSMKVWIRKVENGQVTLRKENGNVVTFSIELLCADDQNELKKLDKQGGGSKPPPPAPGGTPPPAADGTETPAEGGEGATEPEGSKRVYPRTIAELKEACEKARKESMAHKEFNKEECEALAELNVSRILAGVHGEVQLKRHLCEGAARASEACAKIGELSHEASPEGMRCNLHRGQSSFAQSVEGYMEDSGDNNRTHRGHRAWCLHPALGATGFGCDKTEQFFAMWVSNGSSPQPGGTGKGTSARRGFHAWPGEGYFPASRMKGTGWTIYPAEPIGLEEPEVRVFKLSSRLDRPVLASSEPKGAKEVKVNYLRMADLSPWRPGCIVFEPEAEPVPGRIYWVGVKAGSFRMSYCVEFIGKDF